MKQKSQTAASAEEVLGQVANEFFERLAQGENPQIEEYEQRYPDLAAQIRLTFPALGLVGESLSASESVPPPTGVARGQQLGDFRILDELGRGGMGVVYEAEQISMGRRVALKVLPFAMLAGGKSLQRFRNEIRAAATLDHPNIVSVYSVGEDRGINYYAMQLIRGTSLVSVIEHLGELHQSNAAIDGSSISAAISTHKHSRDDGGFASTLESADTSSHRSQLDTMPIAAATTLPSHTTREFYQSVAAIGIQVAKALHYAHEQGIVHRDIKPANLLIDTESDVYIADFGLAQIDSTARVTTAGEVVGTLRYMAPEQALARNTIVDHRADIYSLGATLYELLTCRPVFDGGDRQVLLQQIAFDEPLKLRSVDSAVPIELETIVHKSLSKNPVERYATAGELAYDLLAFCENRPIRATRPTTLQRFRKWTQRHKTFVSALVVAMSIVVTIGGVLLWLERSRTLEALAQVSEQRQAADENFQLARDAVDNLLTEVAENELLDAPSLQPLRRTLLTQALTYYTEFVAKKRDDNTLHVELANAYWRVGEISFLLGDRTEARRAYERAVELRKTAAKNRPDDDAICYQLAESYHQLAKLYRDEKKLVYGEKLAQQSHTIAFRLNARQPTTMHRHLLSETLFRLGDFRWNAGDFDTAAPLFSQAIAIREDIVKSDASSERLWELAEGYRMHGVFFDRSGQRDKSVEAYSKALSTYEKVKADEIGQIRFDRRVAQSHSRLAAAQLALPDHKERALVHLEAAIEIASRNKKANPALEWPRRQLPFSFDRLARIHRDSKRYEEAIDALRNALREYLECYELGFEYLAGEALIAMTYSEIAEVHRSAGQYQKAIDSYRDSDRQWQLKIRESPNNADYKRGRSDNLWRWCQVHRELGPSEDATTVHWDCVRSLEQLINKNPEVPSYPWMLRSLFDDLLVVSSDSPLACNRVAWFLVTAENESVHDAARAVDLAKSATATRDENAFFWYTLGAALYRANRWDEAAEAFSKARDFRNRKSRGFAGFFFAMNAWQLKRAEDAREYFHEAVAWMDENNKADRELSRLRREASELLEIED